MQSKDGEWVEFETPCLLNGQVEMWLSRLLKKQCETIFYWLKNAVTTYTSRSREQWAMNNPAQIAMTASQIWWTTEVNSTFSRMEAGYETALKEYNKKQMCKNDHVN